MPSTSIEPCPRWAFLHGPRNGWPPPDLVECARAYIAASDWTFVKTMPDNPHWYVVRQRAWAQGPEMGERPRGALGVDPVVLLLAAVAQSRLPLDRP